jgi:hypothetical protein
MLFSMSRCLTRTFSLIAVALIAMVQATVSPASCCVLKFVVVGSDTCSVVAPAAKAPSCCHRRAATEPVTPVHQPRVPFEQSKCPICAADAKLMVGDRVAAPSPLDGDVEPIGRVADADLVTPDDDLVRLGSAFGTGEPLQRTALALCAWLCVWRL